MKKIYLCALLLYSMFAQANPSFVIKKAKKPSLYSLKESCCNRLAALIKEIPNALRSISRQPATPSQLIECLANLQEFAYAELELYVEGSPDSFCKRGTKKELESFLARLESAQTDLCAVSRSRLNEPQIVAHLERNTALLVEHQKRPI